VDLRRPLYSGGGLKVRLLSGRHGLVARIDGRRLTTHDLPPGRQIWCTWDRRAAQVMAA
jgi:hypothetical protein